jgi:ABC-type molybdate transport system ATPase subunit
MPEEDTEKINLTLKEKTRTDLLERYPDALSVQEAARMAISDAMRGNQ